MFREIVENCIYTKKDYELYKDTCINMINTDNGDYNFEYVIFIESKDDMFLKIAHQLSRYIVFNKDDKTCLVMLVYNYGH